MVALISSRSNLGELPQGKEADPFQASELDKGQYGEAS